MRVLTVIGARPQFIKAAVVSHAFKKGGQAEEILLHTGQHFDNRMSQIFFDELKLPMPKYYLDINSLSHGAMTGRMLEGIEKALQEERPDAVLVYGDTNSTLAGALAAAKLHIPLAHVEAGLRSFNRRMPEEINRVLTDHLSALLFAPTASAEKNLAAEGVADKKIRRTGDVMYDASVLFADHADKVKLPVERKNFILLTFHREENTGDEGRLRAILDAMNELAKHHPVVFPIHPRTRKIIAGLSIVMHSNIDVIDPVGFLEMLRLECQAAVIVTDSGGVQKEAYFHRVPCVTIRTETEWTELVDAGWNRLADPSDQGAIVRAVENALRRPGRDVDLYGDGKAAEKIAASILEIQELGL